MLQTRPPPVKPRGMALSGKLLVAFGLIGCISWLLVVGSVSAATWSQTERSIERERDEGKAFCGVRYAEKDAKARCVDLFEVQFVQERNSAIATRAIIALLPFAGFGLWYGLWGRRSGRHAAS